MQVNSVCSALSRRAVTCAAALLLLSAIPASAAVVRVDFTGMDLVYDGSSIFDAGSSAGGVGDPADGDPLTAAAFYFDDVFVGGFGTGIALDIFIPDVSGISAAPNAFDVQTTPGNPGYFDLLIGAPAVTNFLRVDLKQVALIYNEIANTVQFTFGAAVSEAFTASMPFTLQIFEPISISFSAQVAPGTLTDDGVNVTGFVARGSGEINGQLIPEPSTTVLAACGLLNMAAMRRRQ